MSRKHKKDGLESKVRKFPKTSLKRDQFGEQYVPLCNYSWHQGVILDEEVCIKRNCVHYSRAYINRTHRPNSYLFKRED